MDSVHRPRTRVGQLRDRAQVQGAHVRPGTPNFSGVHGGVHGGVDRHVDRGQSQCQGTPKSGRDTQHDAGVMPSGDQHRHPTASGS